MFTIAADTAGPVVAEIPGRDNVPSRKIKRCSGPEVISLRARVRAALVYRRSRVFLSNSLHV